MQYGANGRPELVCAGWPEPRIWDGKPTAIDQAMIGEAQSLGKPGARGKVQDRGSGKGERATQWSAEELDPKNVIRARSG
jgi:hypothetical protein